MDKTYTEHVDVIMDDNTYVTGQNNITMAFPDVTKAYFAWDQRNPKSVDKIENGQQVYDKKKQKVKETKTNITLSEIDTGIYSNKYYIVVETKNFLNKDSEDRKITISLHSKNGILSTKDAAIELTYVDTDATTKELLFNNFYKDDNIYNKDSFKNKVVYEITLSPTDETKRKTWIDKLSGGGQEALYIKVEVSGVNGIHYQGKELKDNKDCNKFLFDNPVNIYRCYCDRDLTAKEMEYILSKLKNEIFKSDSFMNGGNSKIKASDRNSQKFVEIFNSTFNKTYNNINLNTCIQKIQFLAQACTETGFTTATERKPSSQRYYPLYGVGMLQLTDVSIVMYYDSKHNTEYEKQYIKVRNDIRIRLETEITNLEHAKTEENKKIEKNRNIELIKQQDDTIKKYKKFARNYTYISEIKPYLDKADSKNNNKYYREIVDKYDQFEKKMTDFANKIETNIDDTFACAEWYWTKFKKGVNAYKYADEDNFEKIQDIVNERDVPGRAKKKKDVETLKSLFGYPDKCATKKSKTQK